LTQSGLSTKSKSLVQLSDKLRELRFAIRRVREVTGQTAQRDRHSAIYNLAHMLANASDSVFSTAESGLISMLSGDPESHAGNADAYGFERYRELASIPAADHASLNPVMLRFTRDQYFSAKRVLLMTGNTNALVHQENFLKIWEEVSPGMRLLFKEGSLGPTEISTLAARFTLACVKAKPVRVPEQFEHSYQDSSIDTNVFLASTLSLIGGVTLTNEDNPESEIIYRSCIAASFARHQAVINALKNRSPEKALTQFYLHIMDHLP